MLTLVHRFRPRWNQLGQAPRKQKINWLRVKSPTFFYSGFLSDDWDLQMSLSAFLEELGNWIRNSLQHRHRSVRFCVTNKYISQSSYWNTINPFLPDWHVSIFLQTILLVNGEPLGQERVKGKFHVNDTCSKGWAPNTVVTLRAQPRNVTSLKNMNHFCASDISSAEFVFNKVKLQQWVQPLLGLSQSNTLTMQWSS